jgi:hypothetical protein
MVSTMTVRQIRRLENVEAKLLVNGDRDAVNQVNYEESMNLRVVIYWIQEGQAVAELDLLVMAGRRMES